MLQVRAQQYVDLGLKIGNLVRELRDLCAQIPLNHSYELLRPFKDDPPRTERELEIIVHSMTTELQARTFLCLAGDKALYYEHDGLLSPDARAAFPLLTQELRSAATCYALELPTACVFHGMRALEHALDALARDVGLKWTTEQWHNIIELIESKIEDERKSLPKGLPKNERLNFLSQAAKEFFYFKDGWRNYVSHNRVAYQDVQALRVLDHVKALVEHLATKLKE